LSEIGYNEISKSWQEEMSTDSLLDLADLRLSKMVSYLSKVRLQLASVGPDNKLQATLLTQEALNLEFMLEDLLLIRRRKILDLVIKGRRPAADMTLDEEDFFKLILTAFTNHKEFVRTSLAGTKKMAKADPAVDEESPLEIEYVTVRFLKDVETAFMGLDGQEHGPFKKEDIAMIPTDNALNWLRNGTVARVVFEDEVARSGR